MEELSRPGPRGGLCWGQSEDVAVLQQHVRELQVQLQNSNKALQRLQRRTRSFSSTSDYASGAERLYKLVPSATDEDEGWQSDGVGAFCPPALQASRDLEWLVHRVSLLEAQLPGPPAGGVLPEELKYDSLIQAQARELSHLRQKMREGRSVCRLLTQHLRDTVKSFEELLRGTDIDYYMGQSFREHLAQGGQLAERLSSKLSSSAWVLCSGMGAQGELALCRPAPRQGFGAEPGAGARSSGVAGFCLALERSQSTAPKPCLTRPLWLCFQGIALTWRIKPDTNSWRSGNHTGDSREPWDVCSGRVPAALHGAQAALQSKGHRPLLC
uniref:Uncharacterized protein n=1 Tax=Terrapene triunguis TaxID=2587831 RepID=A0A674IKW3_9SAUR